MKLSMHSSIVTAVLIWLLPRPAFATHASGGENDLMALYGGIGLVVGFAGLLGALGLVPRKWRPAGRRWGNWLVAAGAAILLIGGYHVTTLGSEAETLGGTAWGRMATQQLVGSLIVFGLFFGGAFYLGKRSGILDMGEGVKYSVLRNGDPADRSAAHVARPGEQRIMWIPLAAMGVLALFFTAGVLIVLYRLSASSGA